MAAAGSLAREFCEETTCAICLEHFTDPVTVDCGHNFCRACLTQCWGAPGGSAPCCCCPHCREPVQPGKLRSNRQLASIVEITKKFRRQVEKEAQKSPPGGVCTKHQEPLKLFCSDDRAPICASKAGPAQAATSQGCCEEVGGNREDIKVQLPSLEKKREELVEQKLTEEQKHQEYLFFSTGPLHGQNTCSGAALSLTVVSKRDLPYCAARALLQAKKLAVEKEIVSVIAQMHKFLEEKKHSWLIQLADLEKEIKKRQKENIVRLSEEISHFNDLIKDVEGKFQLPSIEFLQDFECTFSRCQQGQERQRLELSPGLEWELRNYSPKSSILKKAMKEFAGSLKEAMNKVNVTLDPSTAHVDLVISEDLKSIRWEVRQDLDSPFPSCNPERFESETCVLGRESFTSGRHWWEVEVEVVEEEEEEMKEENWEWWAVGVAQESLKKNYSFNLGTDEGIWAIGKDSSRSLEGLAFTSPEPTTLTSRCRLRKIRLFLDYEEGQVEFFDSDTGDLIFTFPSASFSGERIRPFFWVNLGTRLKC
ncbi:E3 ubiquitin-protein ligase TRIM11-like [Tiliqua scincoides]|uniref:E3 ubiquitin-protein ligase TRIM11-like n=1 Tax=Tiliqua scincoides TaxID=71010 RepID=UPI00346366AA